MAEKSEPVGPPASSFDSSAKKGWLTKLGGHGFQKNWRKRWFILEDNYIYYYKTMEDKEPVGIIDLDRFTQCIPAAEDECKKSKFAFKLANTADPSARAYIAFADSDENCKSWIAAINKQLDPSPSEKDTHEPAEPVLQLNAASPQPPSLTHVTKSRPIQKGKRAPSRKPPAKVFDEEVMSSDEEDSVASPPPRKKSFDAATIPIAVPKGVPPPAAAPAAEIASSLPKSVSTEKLGGDTPPLPAKGKIPRSTSTNSDQQVLPLRADDGDMEEMKSEKAKAKELLKRAQDAKQEIDALKVTAQEELEQAKRDRAEAARLKAEAQRELEEARQVKARAVQESEKAERDIAVLRNEAMEAKQEAEESKRKAKEILKRAQEAKEEIERNSSKGSFVDEDSD